MTPEPPSSPPPAGPSPWPGKTLAGLRGLSPLRLAGLMATGLLSTALLAQGVQGVNYWEDAPVTPELILQLSVLPGLISPLLYAASLRRPGRPAPARWGHDSALNRTLGHPVQWGVLTALAVGAQFVGVGVLLAIAACVLPLPMPGSDLTGLRLFLPPPVFWMPLVAATLRLLAQATISPLDDRTAPTLRRRLLPLWSVLAGLILTNLLFHPVGH